MRLTLEVIIIIILHKIELLDPSARLVIVDNVEWRELAVGHVVRVPGYHVPSQNKDVHIFDSEKTLFQILIISVDLPVTNGTTIPVFNTGFLTLLYRNIRDLSTISMLLMKEIEIHQHTCKPPTLIARKT
jgi:hypothetical protein